MDSKYEPKFGKKWNQGKPLQICLKQDLQQNKSLIFETVLQVSNISNQSALYPLPCFQASERISVYIPRKTHSTSVSKKIFYFMSFYVSTESEIPIFRHQIFDENLISFLGSKNWKLMSPRNGYLYCIEKVSRFWCIDTFSWKVYVSVSDSFKKYLWMHWPQARYSYQSIAIKLAIRSRIYNISFQV